MCLGKSKNKCVCLKPEEINGDTLRRRQFIKEVLAVVSFTRFKIQLFGFSSYPESSFSDGCLAGSGTVDGDTDGRVTTPFNQPIRHCLKFKILYLRDVSLPPHHFPLRCRSLWTRRDVGNLVVVVVAAVLVL